MHSITGRSAVLALIGLMAIITLLFAAGLLEGHPEAQGQSQFAVGKADVQRDSTFNKFVIEGSYTGTDGKPIRFKRYEKLGQDKAFLIWIDGMGGFIEQQEALFTSLNEFPGYAPPFAETLADLPMTVLTLDLPGRGLLLPAESRSTLSPSTHSSPKCAG